MIQRKKNKFFTFLWALIPGAGHMNMGFMKEGLSLLSFFFGCIFISAYFNIEAGIFILPVIWFYSFFDAINKNSLPDEDFYSLEDHFLFHFNSNIRNYPTIIAFILIFFGVYLTLKGICDLLPYYISDLLYPFIYNGTFPQLFFGSIIVLCGIRLIKKNHTNFREHFIIDEKENL